MRKVTMYSVKAFLSGANFKRGNTQVVSGFLGTDLMLHGNCIAYRHPITDEVRITSAGWRTNTTKERLNGLIFSMTGTRNAICQRNFEWYFMDKPWDDCVGEDGYITLPSSWG